MKDRKSFLGHLALWGTAFIWGTSFVILKEALDSIGTMWVLALRFIIAAHVSTPYDKLQEGTPIFIDLTQIFAVCLSSIT